MNKLEFLKQADGQFTLTGVLDKKTITSLWTKRKLLKPMNQNLNIDLSGVTHSDSAGLALLICLKKEAIKAKTQISFSNIPEQMQQLIALSALEDILTARQGL